MDKTAIGLQLRLSGTSGANATTKSLQVTPLPYEPGQKILVLGQLNLEFSFMSSSFSGEYVQNQSSAVNDFDSQCLFEISLLPRRQLLIEDYCVILGLLFELD
jgi:hypothetical protein